MAPRQVWLFQLGCWVALLTAALQLAAHLFTPAVSDPHAVVGLGLLQPGHVFVVPGLRRPTFMSVLDGLSLSVAVLLATIGLAGLAVLRHGHEAPQLMRSVAGALAIGSALVLIVSVVDMFSAQTFLLVVVTMCFGMAAVNPEA